MSGICLVDRLRLPLQGTATHHRLMEAFKKCTLALSEGSALLQRIFITGD
jgi:hypothetical protein